MKKVFTSFGLVALIGAMIYSSLSLIPKRVSASGVACCSYASQCESGFKCEPAGTASCNDPQHQERTGFCVKRCTSEMECDEDGGSG